jgi:RimJ/RimL family protein N-acetyltransferase
VIVPETKPPDPKMLDFPDSFETERLLIRAPRAGDGPEQNAAIVESLDDLRPWMPWAKEAPTPDETESHCRRSAAKFILREDIHWRGFLKGTDTFVLGSGLHRIDWAVPKFEIGYWVRSRFAGQGYVTEAVRGIAGFAFERLGANRVEIRCDETNRRSWAIPQRLGFELEAVFRHDARATSGELRNTRIYALTRPPE